VDFHPDVAGGTEPEPIDFTATAPPLPEPVRVDFASGKVSEGSDTGFINPVKVVKGIISRFSSTGEGGDADAGSDETAGADAAPDSGTPDVSSPDTSAGNETDTNTGPDTQTHANTDTSSPDTKTQSSSDTSGADTPKSSTEVDKIADMDPVGQRKLFEAFIDYLTKLKASGVDVDTELENANKQKELDSSSASSSGAAGDDKPAAEQEDPYRNYRSSNGDADSTSSDEKSTDNTNNTNAPDSSDRTKGDNGTFERSDDENNTGEVDVIPEMEQSAQQKLKARWLNFLQELVDSAEDVDMGLLGENQPKAIEDGSDGSNANDDEAAASQDDAFAYARSGGLPPDAEKPDPKSKTKIEQGGDNGDRSKDGEKNVEDGDQPGDKPKTKDDNNTADVNKNTTTDQPDNTTDTSGGDKPVTDDTSSQPDNSNVLMGNNESANNTDTADNTADTDEQDSESTSNTSTQTEDIVARPLSVEELGELSGQGDATSGTQNDPLQTPLVDQVPLPPPVVTPPVPTPIYTAPETGATTSTADSDNEYDGPSTVLPPIGEATTTDASGETDSTRDTAASNTRTLHADTSNTPSATGEQRQTAGTDATGADIPNQSIQDKKVAAATAAADAPRQPRATMAGGASTSEADNLGSPLDGDVWRLTGDTWTQISGVGVDPTTNSGAGTQPNAHGGNGNEEDNNAGAGGGDPNDPSSPSGQNTTTANSNDPNTGNNNAKRNDTNANKGDDNTSQSQSSSSTTTTGDPNSTAGSGSSSGQNKARAAKEAKIKARQHKLPKDMTPAEQRAYLDGRIHNQMIKQDKLEDMVMSRKLRNTLAVGRVIAAGLAGTVGALSPVSSPVTTRVLKQSKLPGRFPVEFTDSKGNKVIKEIWAKSSEHAQKRAGGFGLGTRIAAGKLLVRRL
jgi:hypothetical protein